MSKIWSKSNLDIQEVQQAQSRLSSKKSTPRSRSIIINCWNQSQGKKSQKPPKRNDMWHENNDLTDMNFSLETIKAFSKVLVGGGEKLPAYILYPAKNIP